MNGPHARVRYASLSELLGGEAATLAPVPYLARYQRGNQVIEVRLEWLESGEAIALMHDVSAELHQLGDEVGSGEAGGAGDRDGPAPPEFGRRCPLTLRRIGHWR